MDTDMMLEVSYLHRKLQGGQYVLHFRLENFWSQFSFRDAHLVGEEHYLQENGNKKTKFLVNSYFFYFF